MNASSLSPELRVIFERQMARNAASRARFLGNGNVPIVGTAPAPMPAWQPGGNGAQKPWGKLPIDRMPTEEAEEASNRSGRGGLQAYMKLWGRSL